MTELEQMGKRAKEAARELAFAGDKKNQGLAAIAKALREHKDNIIEANALDIEAAKQNGMSESLLDRLTLTSERIEGMAKGVEEVLALKDPIGTVLDGMVQSNGLKIEKVRVPLGVIGMIYEARCDFRCSGALFKIG